RSDYLDPADLVDLDADGTGATLQGLRANIGVSLRYLTAWLQGRGAVAINNLMEDAATVEIARTQVWQWLRHGVRLEDGLDVTTDLAERIIDNESAEIGREMAGAAAQLSDASTLFRDVALSPDLEEFFTERAYAQYL